MSALLDTSVIVRYITGDSGFLSELSARIIDGDEQSVVTDALLWATARMRGEPVRTFDRRFPGDGIELLTPAGGA